MQEPIIRLKPSQTLTCGLTGVHQLFTAARQRFARYGIAHVSGEFYAKYHNPRVGNGAGYQ